MKKAVILLFAAFYLMLSTGGYMCAMHCTTAKLIQPKTTDCCNDMAGMVCHKDQTGSPKKEKGNCRDNHGNYVVKENLKPSFNFSVQKQAAIALLQPLVVYSSSLHYTGLIEVARNAKAPPDVYGKPYLIRLGTLLI